MIDCLEEGLIGYTTLDDSIVFVTDTQIILLAADGARLSAPIRGTSVINFVVSRNH